ncbi:hypothetical protein Clacol_005427 [Clathrus columnatus]|uniref:Calcineurin-like phosphoesterase domain-containing protein n=1 Tax=Clathrus columnatus TaxID=1419009 RepID=A0AAV5AE67_9AGAM|nr:hypothetical protein Clacol_005427 [Clathrus columnatus]
MAIASFCGRLLRFIKATGTQISAFILFSGLLTYIFILYQPSNGPGESQQVGWQSWELVSSFDKLSQQPLNDDITSTLPLDNTTDWWDTEATEVTVSDTSSLPLTPWNPLLPHDTGFPPEVAQVCRPPTTPADDAKKGQWVRVERDINLRSRSWYYLHMYYRRTRKRDIPLITDLKLLPAGGEDSLPDRHHWYSTGTSLREGVQPKKPLYLWYKLGPPLQQLDKNQTNNLITELDVIYGPGPVMHGYQPLQPYVTEEGATDFEPVKIAYRRGPLPYTHWCRCAEIEHAPPLHFKQNVSTSHGECRDTDRVPCQWGDDLTSDLVASVLDAEKPDLVLFSGDQLNGQGSSWDSRSVLAKFAVPVIERKIPWAAIFGNHDDETDLSREYEMKHFLQLPYFVGSAGPSDVHGVGNYVLKVYSPDPSKTHVLTLYMLDSGAYDTGFWSPFGFLATSYDYLRESQIEWFLSESDKIPPIIRPFKPDTSKDLGKVWKRQAALPSDEEERLAKPNALMFFHIPIPEVMPARDNQSVSLTPILFQAYNDADVDPVTGKTLNVGQQLDGKGSPKKNVGFFDKAVLSAPESEDGVGREVKVIGNGHSHVSENCRRIRGVWLCFGGGGFDRRFRVYDISEYGETIKTYKRTEHGEIVDEMILAGKGAPAFEG